jgi:hypothetical protein
MLDIGPMSQLPIDREVYIQMETRMMDICHFSVRDLRCDAILRGFNLPGQRSTAIQSRRLAPQKY